MNEMADLLERVERLRAKPGSRGSSGPRCDRCADTGWRPASSNAVRRCECVHAATQRHPSNARDWTEANR